MAINKKRPAVPSVSDRSVEDLENYILGYESVGGGVNYSSESINDPYLSQEVVDILSDPNSDHGIFLAQAMECAGDAARFGQAADTAINNRKTLVALCNAFGRASMSKGYESLTPKSFWYSLEASGFADDAKDFGKRVWEAIKAAIKKLILMVINLVKSIGNFIKGAAAKAQEFFWKKYGRKVLENAKLSAKKDVKMKIRSVSASKVWKQGGRPDELLRKQCAIITKSLSVAQGIVSGNIMRDYMNVSHSSGSSYIVNNKHDAPTGNGSTNQQFSSSARSSLGSRDPKFDAEMKKAISIFNEQELGFNVRKMKKEAGKWFPSAASVVNYAVYGKEKPSKNEVQVNTIIEEGKSLLEPGTLQAMSYCFKTANTANKALQSTLNTIEKMAKANTASLDREDRASSHKDRRKDVSEPMHKIRRLMQFLTTMLIHLYGVCLSARMTVYSAARKLVKKGNDKDDNKKGKKGDKAEGAADAASVAG